MDSFATVDIIILCSFITPTRNFTHCRLSEQYRVLQHHVVLLRRLLLYVGTIFNLAIMCLVLSCDYKLVGNILSLDYLYSKHINGNSDTFVG